MKEEKFFWVYAEVVEVGAVAAQDDTDEKKFALLIHTNSRVLDTQIFIFSTKNDADEAQRLLDCARTPFAEIFVGHDSTGQAIAVLKKQFCEPDCHVFHFTDKFNAQIAATVATSIYDLPF